MGATLTSTVRPHLQSLGNSYVEDNDIGHSDSSFENVDSIIS